MLSFRKRPFVSLTVLVLALLLTGAGIALYRQSTFEQRWASVSEGMSKDEVRRLLGDPDELYPASRSGSIVGTLVDIWLFDSGRERWAYGRRPLIASEPTFPYFGLALEGFLGPESDDHVVYFAKDGRVVSKKSPDRVAQASAPAP